jgi:hypothetical protein
MTARITGYAEVIPVNPTALLTTTQIISSGLPFISGQPELIPGHRSEKNSFRGLRHSMPCPRVLLAHLLMRFQDFYFVRPRP